MCKERKINGEKREKERPGKVGVGKFWAWQNRGITLAANFLVLGYLSMYCTDLLYTLTNSVFATLLNANGNLYILRAFKRQEQYVTINVFGRLAIMLSSIVMSMSLPVVIAQKAVTAAGWSSLIMMYATCSFCRLYGGGDFDEQI